MNRLYGLSYHSASRMFSFPVSPPIADEQLDKSTARTRRGRVDRHDLEKRLDL